MDRTPSVPNKPATRFDPYSGIARRHPWLWRKTLFHPRTRFWFFQNSEETQKIWGDQVTEDMVRVIRSFRPNIVINNWGGVHSGHGHHQASGILTPKACSLPPMKMPTRNCEKKICRRGPEETVRFKFWIWIAAAIVQRATLSRWMKSPVVWQELPADRHRRFCQPSHARDFRVYQFSVLAQAHFLVSRRWETIRSRHSCRTTPSIIRNSERKSLHGSC